MKSGYTKKCPFLKPFEVKDNLGTQQSVEQECIKEKCELWVSKNKKCAIVTIAESIKGE